MSRPPPAPDEAHVWRLRLPTGPAGLPRLEPLLAPDELARADRLRSETARARFVATRGALRHLLAGYLDADPARLRLVYAEGGKPRLEGGGPAFNVSHSGELALLAFTAGPPVGVDVERIRPLALLDRVAARILPEAELAGWRALPPEARTDDFFRRWTRLEALAKLHGAGVWGVLDRVEELGAATRFHALEAPPGWRACLATAPAVSRVRVMELDREALEQA